MLTIFIFISSSTFYSKVLPFIELVFENRVQFSIVFSIVLLFLLLFSKKWGLEFLIKLFLKGRADNCTSSKSWQGFPWGGPPLSSMSLFITAVSPP